MSVDNRQLRCYPQPHDHGDERDRIIILSTMVPYEQNWGGYSGLPCQHDADKSGTGVEKAPSDFILPFLKQYQLAQTHIHVGRDKSGKFVVLLPNYLICDKKSNDGKNLRVIIEKIAEPNPEGHFVPLSVSGPFVTFPLAPQFIQTLNEKNVPWKTGSFRAIGEHLSAELFSFVQSEPDNDSNPFSTMLLPVMPWIVAHKTPHFAATLIHLQTNFSGVCEAFTATGPDDLRNLLCVAGLDIDMRGFRGRTERYFVPWQACWKRHGHCYGDIYPLHQEDLLVALKNM